MKTVTLALCLCAATAVAQAHGRLPDMPMSAPAQAVARSGSGTPPSPAVSALKLLQGWVAAAPPGAEELAGYLKLGNPGPKDVTLVGLSTSVSRQPMLMITGKDAGGRETMRMASRLTVPAGGRLNLLPGAGHLMLRVLSRQPQPGEEVTVALHFSDGSVRSFRLPVRRWP